jgi:hypothetical protein
MSPLDQYEEARKTAGVGNMLGRAGRGFADAMTPERVGGAAAVGLAGAAVAGLGTAAQKIVGAITKQRDFRRMMEMSPDLSEERDRNPERFNQHYSSLRSLSPEFASDPVIAATYMRQMSYAPESAGKVLVESIGSRPKQQAQPPWMQSAMRGLGPQRPQPPALGNPAE